METKEKETSTIAGGQKTVSITRIFDASVDKVWKAWTEAEAFKKWWGPNDYTCSSAKLDVRVGGKMHASMKGPDGKEIWSTGTYKEVVPQKKLVVTDKFADSDGNEVQPSYYGMPGEWPKDVVVTVTLEESNGKTKMTMQQTNVPAEMYDDCVKGWQQC